MRKNQMSWSSGDGERYFFNKAADAMLVADARTRKLVDVNPAAVRLMGHSRKKLLTMKADQLHPEEVRKETIEAFKKHASGSKKEVESLVVTSRGKRIPVSIHTSSISMNGKTYLLGIFRNISRQKKESDKLTKSENRSRMLKKVALLMLQVTDPLKRYNYLLDYAREMTGSKFGLLGYIDPETGYFVSPTLTRDVWDACKIDNKDVVFKKNTGLCGCVLKEKKIVLSNDPENDPDSSPPPKGHIKIQNFLGVPCLWKKKIVGMIALANREGGFSREEAGLISDYSRLLTIAILDHYKLIEKQKTDEALKKSQQLKRNLLDINKKISLCHDFSEAWKAAGGPIAKTIGAMAASFFMPNDEKTHFRLIGEYGLSKTYLKRINEEFPIPFTKDSVFGTAFFTKKTAFTRDIEADPMFGTWRELARKEGYRSLIVIPIIPEKETLGIAVFYFADPKGFQKEEIQLTQLAVNQLTPALSRIEFDRKIRGSEHFNRTIISSVNEGIIVYDREFRYKLWNKFMEDLTGFSAEKVLGKNAFDLFPHLKEQGVHKLLEQALKGRTVRSPDTPYHAPGTGKKGWVVGIYSPHRMPDGEIMGVVASVRDITQRKHAEIVIYESEERYRSLVHTAPSVIVGLTPEHKIFEFNPEAERLYGMKREDVLGKDYFELFVPEKIRDAVAADIKKVLDGQILRGVENEIVMRDGRHRALSWSVKCVLNKNGEAAGVIAIGQDITEKKLSEDALKESHKRLLAVLDSLDSIVYVSDMQTNEVLFVNQYTRNIFGDVVGRLCWKTIQKDQTGPCVFCTNDKLLTPGGEPAETCVWEFQNTIDGRWYYIRDRAIRWIDGRLVRLEIATDITERKKIEQALRESEQKFRTIFESSPLGIVHLNTDGVVTACNQQFLDILGARKEKMIGFNSMAYVVDYRMKSAIALALSGQRGFFEGKYLTITGGKEIIIKAEFSGILAEDGTLLGAIGVFEDVSKRKQAEEKLISSEHSYRTLAANLPGIVYRVFIRENNRMQFFNNVSADIIGYSEDELPPGKICSTESLIIPEDRQKVLDEVERAISEDRTFAIEYRIRHKDGNIRVLFENGTPIRGEDGEPLYIDGVIFNMTERKRLEEELARAHRLEAAGRVAGQIAHDFNNLLSPLMAYPDLIRIKCHGNDSVMPLVDKMQAVAVQMAEINQQLLTLGRRGYYNLTTINLNRLMEKLLDSLSLPATVVIQKEFNQDLFPIKGGAAQLTRVFTNLINNAVEAMGDIGKLNISMQNIYLDRALKGYETIQIGEYVKVCIEDTGCGIEPEALENIFEPFFTTKVTDKQRGSGLGLSVVRAVLEDHHGYIGIDSVPGQRAAFTLYFPITREIESDKKSSFKGIPKGNERVLVVDDDPIQREVLTRLLNQLGYKNHAVENGEMAVAYVKAHPQDILILDMIMKGMDGAETYRRIKEIYPDQKAVILSGYAESERVAEAQRLGADAYIRKPVDLVILAGTIRKALER